MLQVNVRERNIAHLKSLVYFPLSNESHTLCKVTNEGSLDFDGLFKTESALCM